MKIEELRIDIIELGTLKPEWRPLRQMQEYPDSHRIKFAHRPFTGEGITGEPIPAYAAILNMQTADGIESPGVLWSSWSREQLEWDSRTFKVQWDPELVGMNALDREYIWHKMWMARRYFHMPTITPLSLIDELLWDLAGQKSGLPVHKLIGGFRDKVPAYLTETAVSFEDTLSSAQRAKEQGFLGFKDHAILGVATNIELAGELRNVVGDDMVLMHDPVQQYTVDEAIKVGRELEKLGFLWMEEPLQESDINGLKRISDALDISILALESVQGAPYLAVPYLSSGSIDIVRQTGMGITGQIKLANLAEMFGANCHGGNPHVVAAIRNDDWWEHPAWQPTSPDRVLTTETSKLIRNTHWIEDGYMHVPQTPGLGREIKWNQIKDRSILSI